MNYFSSPQGDNKAKTDAATRNITRDMSPGKNDQSWTTTKARAKSSDFYNQQHQLYNFQPSNSLWWNHLSQHQYQSQPQYQVHPSVFEQSASTPGFLYSSERWQQQLLANQTFSAPPPPYPQRHSQSYHQIGINNKNTFEQGKLQHSIESSVPQPPPPPPLPSTLHPLPPPLPQPAMKQETQQPQALWTSSVPKMDISMKEQLMQASRERTALQTESAVKKENSLISNHLGFPKESQSRHEDSDDLESTIESVQMDISVDSDSDDSQDNFDHNKPFEKEETTQKFTESKDSLDDPTKNKLSNIFIDNIPYVHESNEQNKERKIYPETESKKKDNKSQTSSTWTSSKPPSPSSVHQYINDWSGSSPSSKNLSPVKDKAHIEFPRKFNSGGENDDFLREVIPSNQENQRSERNIKDHQLIHTDTKTKPEHDDNMSSELAKKRARVLQSIHLVALKRRKIAEIQYKALPRKIQNSQQNRRTNEEKKSSENYDVSKVDDESSEQDITELSQRTLMSRKIAEIQYKALPRKVQNSQQNRRTNEEKKSPENHDVVSKVDDKSSLPDITALSQRIFIRKISQSGPVNKVRIQDEKRMKEKLFDVHKNTATTIDADKIEAKVESKNILLDIEKNQRQNDEHRIKLARLKVLLAAKVREKRQNKRKISPVVAAKEPLKSPETFVGDKMTSYAQDQKGEKSTTDMEILHTSPKPPEKVLKEESKSNGGSSSPFLLSPSKLGGNELKKAHTPVHSSMIHIKLMKQKRELQNSIDLNKMRNIQKQQLELLKVQKGRLQEKTSLLKSCSKEIEVEEKIISMKEQSLKTLQKRKFIMENMLAKMNVKLMDARKRLRDCKEKQSIEVETVEMSHARANSARRGRASDFF